MISSILLGVALVILVLYAGTSAIRGFSKSLLRTATILLSALAAIITCLILKAQLPTADEFVIWAQTNMETVRANLGEEMVEMLESVMELATVSPTLIELVLQLVGALLAPLLCLVLFLVYCIITFIIYFIVKLILRAPLKLLNKAVPLSRLCAAGVGLVEGIIVLAMILLPVSGYMSVAKPVMDGMVQAGAMDAEDPDTQTVLDVFEEIETSPVIVTYRTLGGKALSNTMLDIKVAGEKVNIEEELDPILILVMNITELGEVPMENYTEREAELIRSIGTSFTQSKLLAPIVGDVIFAATDAWANGEEFMGTPKPEMGEADELFGPFMDTLLDILHDDAKTPDLLQKDIQTLADVIAILVKSGVMSNLNDTEALVGTLGGEGVVEDMIETLGTNESMKRLIPEVTNLGVRAIGQILSIPADIDAVYGEFMDEVADALNEIASKPESEQVEILSDRLSSAFDDAGVAIDSEILDFYSASMIHDLVDSNNGEVTAEDVKAFFLLYAENVAGDNTTSSTGYPSIEVLSNSSTEDLLAGTVYGNMTEEQLKKTATATLYKLCVNLSKLDSNDADFSKKAQAMVVESFTDLLGADHGAMETLKNKAITKPVTTDSIQNAAGLKSADALKDTSNVITMQDLLIDTDAAAGKLTTDSIQLEAKAIAAIFKSAGSVLGQMSDSINLTDMAGALGTILDAMKQTDSFGAEKTASLFTAVLQSKTVRESVGLDMATATLMAEKATSGNGSYADTMNSVAGSVDLATKLGNGDEITEDQLVELIRNLTPQTAGMLEVFMTEERLIDMGSPEESAGTGSALLRAIFSYMGRDDLEDYDAEAKGLNQILNMAMAADESENDKLFSSSETANDGVLPTADKVVEDIMGSKAVCYALVEVLTDGNKVTEYNALGFGDDLNDADRATIKTAIEKHMAAHKEISKITYQALASVFNVEIK